MEKPWYETWFGSPYYSLLYSKRNDEEAKEFLQGIMPELHLPEHARILDAPCGEGRHCRALRGKGFRVTGIDLCEPALEKARSMQNENEEFLLHDMRKPFRMGYFHLALNLFTSLGYSHVSDDRKTIRELFRCLMPGGFLVVDFLNVLSQDWTGMPEEEKKTNHIIFHIRKEQKKGVLLKHIRILDGKEEHFFREALIMHSPSDLEQLLNDAGFRVLRRFGDYRLHTFEPMSSPRIILVAQKP